jgi:hypothetical protein
MSNFRYLGDLYRVHVSKKVLEKQDTAALRQDHARLIGQA